MKKRKIIAVDCGWNGAVAHWVESGNHTGVELCPGDCHGIIAFLDDLIDRFADIPGKFEVVLEHNTASPHFGARGNFGLGNNIGCWETALAANGLDWNNISPKKWQTILSCERSRSKKGRKAVKEKAWRLARRRFDMFQDKLGDRVPSVKSKAQGMADALCILEWKRRKE